MQVFAFCVALIISSVCGRKGFGPNHQEWGYVTVRPGANMFWWLHMTTAQVESYIDRPLIIWMQGGPGTPSSGYGNFGEIGPLDADLNPRVHTWIADYNVLYVDTPVGAGFSYADSNNSYAKSNTQMAEDVMLLLAGIHKSLPDLRKVPTYIFCQSYGAKVAAEIALRIKLAPVKLVEMNLIGVGFGSPWISPRDLVLAMGPYLYNLGYLDGNGLAKVHELATDTSNLILDGQYRKAFEIYGLTQAMARNLTDSIDVSNILTKTTPAQSPLSQIDSDLEVPIDMKIKAIMNAKVKQALGIERKWVPSLPELPFENLADEFMAPATNIIEILLNKTDLKIAVFNGQFDAETSPPGTLKWVDELHFKKADQWKNAPRKSIVVDGIVEGYVKKIGNLAFYWVNRAGHWIPADNPAAMSYILNDMVKIW